MLEVVHTLELGEQRELLDACRELVGQAPLEHHFVHHDVRRIVPGTAPALLGVRGLGRINLTASSLVRLLELMVSDTQAKLIPSYKPEM